MSNIVAKLVSIGNNKFESNESEEVENGNGNSRRGRPKGSTKGYIRKDPRWQPKTWRPVHDTIVIQHCAGKSNEEIAALVDYTPTMVSNVLTSIRGKELKNEIQARTREAYVAATEKDQGELALAAAINIKRVLTDPIYFERAPLQIFDRSLAYMKAAGKLTGERPDNRTQNNIFIGADVGKILAEGMAKADQVRLLHAGPPK